MSFDGIILNNIKHELEEALIGARIEKFYQPEEDELTVLFRSSNENLKLLLSSNAKYPRIHLTNSTRTNPDNAPLFCMILRKHLSGGRILKFNQPNFERILEIYIEVLNEFRDLVTKKLVIEIMGKHSNIILVDENDVVIDSIKHVSENISSVRTILPRSAYIYPPNQMKQNPILATKDSFLLAVKSANTDDALDKFLYSTFTGISPLIAAEVCFEIGFDKSSKVSDLKNSDLENLYLSFSKIMGNVLSKNFSGYIIYDDKKRPLDFYSLPLSSVEEKNKNYFKSLSLTLDKFYEEKDKSDRIKQRYSDIKKVIDNHLERTKNKKVLQLRSLEDTKNMDEYKLKGDLILSYIYMIEKGVKEIEVVNFYSEAQEKIKISLDNTLSPSQNAQKLFARYNKMKRTEAAAILQLEESESEINYLESLLASLDSVQNEKDISEVKDELSAGGYIKRAKGKVKKQNEKASPLHYKSSDGFDIYVGKNNYQNDYLTTKFANSNDIWLHTKDIHGSHVIIRTESKPVPDNTIYEAALLSAHYSKASEGSNVPVDYTERKNVKKPSGSKPGFVIYLTNKTKYVTPNNEEIEKIKLQS